MLRRRHRRRRRRITEALSSKAVAAASETPMESRAPVFGLMSVAGRSREMEDAVSVRTNFCRRLPAHFFAVYDGHGGPHVAAQCRERMHGYLEEELMRVESMEESASGEDSQARRAAAATKPRD
ncbi:hypothetical protein L1049_019580 [Liquidambar formosana]|uniref:protein-serine/threonine phosphatase n=1 Tax=Liquidambar formosana TaxID=63359 RepID=A0AAP0SBX8_LIQFO